jgi:hypothetical protein
VRAYVASSWRNAWQPGVVKLLRSLGHEAYDFRQPQPGDDGFHWREVDPRWKEWSAHEYREGLKSPIARRGFKSDADALRGADACIAVQPYGTSTALELGWAAGAGKRTAVLFPHGMELTAIGGHTIDRDAFCEPCTQTRHEPSNCKLPGKLDHVEPELMVLLADAVLIGPEELREWAGIPR